MTPDATSPSSTPAGGSGGHGGWPVRDLRRDPGHVTASPGDCVEPAGTWYISAGTRIELVDGLLHVVESLVSVHLLRAASAAETRPPVHRPTVGAGARDPLSDVDHYLVTTEMLMPPRSSSQVADIHDAGHDR